ncbi:hypothetical protein K413DRAFT_4694 [Clostridium sp. ASBs410]|nr:hypothetical protein K413DRAFT_4694 [Clostridium sp. ASBs410]
MPKGTKYTEEETEWIKKSVIDKTYDSLDGLVSDYNLRFSNQRSKAAIMTKINKDLKLKMDNQNRFTEKEIEWLIDNCRKYKINDFVEEHNKIFSKRNMSVILGFLSKNGIHMKLWLPQEDEWIITNYYMFDTFEGLLSEFNNVFDRKRSLHSFSLHCQNVLKLKRYVPFSEIEVDWISDNFNNYTYDEMTKKFNELFKKDCTVAAIETYCFRKLKLKKDDPHKFNARRRPIGHKINMSGRIYVKINKSNYKLGNKQKSSEIFEPLSRIKWQEYHNKKVQDDCQITFLNGNTTDLSKDNLYCIKKRFLPYMINNKWFSNNPEITFTAIKWCELMYDIKDN